MKYGCDDQGLIGTIKVKRNTNGDTRVATKKPTFDEFDKANRSHVEDVKNLLHGVGTAIRWRGTNHDWTKIQESFRSMFYMDLCDTMDGKIEFEEGEWAKLHYSTERHHLRRNVPDDVNLLDVIEMIADCVCAGMARSGYVNMDDDYYKVPEEILVRALNNTVELFANAIVIEEDKDE